MSFAKALKCGFQGTRWGSDKGPHFAWCLLVDNGLGLNRKRTRAPPI